MITRKLLATLVLFAGIVAYSTAQYQSISFTAAPMRLQGETVGIATDPASLGYDVALGLSQTLDDERWKLVAELSYYSGSQTKDFGPFTLNSAFSATTVTVGVRYMLTNSVNRYNPYTGQIIPFLGFAAGMSNVTVNLNSVPSDASLSFETKERGIYAPVAEGQFGFEIVLNRNIKALIFGAVRVTTSDYLDGVKGTTNFPDLLGRGGIGLVYDLR